MWLDNIVIWQYMEVIQWKTGNTIKDKGTEIIQRYFFSIYTMVGKRSDHRRLFRAWKGKKIFAVNISGDRQGLFYCLRERRVTMLLMGEYVLRHVVLDAYRISRTLGLGLRLKRCLYSKKLDKIHIYKIKVLQVLTRVLFFNT